MNEEKGRLLDIWGGFECTINRTNDQYHDQFEHSGHYERKDDIDKVASLGIKALRYPILWEKHEPIQGITINWNWITQQLNAIKKNNIEPIAGLVHHGSGPKFTNLLDDTFPEKLAAFAGQVAKQFPWLTYYTPINEPLTTARFSGLYGFWYPHKNNDVSFLRMLMNEVKATVLAMQAIRQVNPNAKLVQTEDLAKTYSTPLLQYQADFENHRRWLSLDLLMGFVTQKHPLWNYCMRLGIKEEELLFFAENPCPPHIIGANYYVTSERFLDERIERYPAQTIGSNDIHRYADVEAIRVPFEQPHGFKVVVNDLWERYHLPIAITEVHLGCTREEQMRWFYQLWQQSIQLKESGIDIKAVTAWSLIGSFGWNSLLTADNFNYECGVFAIRNKHLYATATASLIQKITSNNPLPQTLLQGKGWWQKSSRYYWIETQQGIETAMDHHKNDTCGILITGKNGTLGRAFARICEERSIPHLLVGRQELNICNAATIEAVIQQYKPWAIINTAGYVRVEEAEYEADKCYEDNTLGAMLLAKACAQHGIKFMTFSSDLVFNGDKQEPYVESDMPQPLNVYGKSKALAEMEVVKHCADALIIRTSAFFGAWDHFNFAHHVLHACEAGKEVVAANDVFISPTYVPHLVDACLQLLVDDENGIFHLANEGNVSWAAFAAAIAERAAFNKNAITSKSRQEIYSKVSMPAYTCLGSEKGVRLPPLNEAIDAFLAARMVHMGK